jgi:hypothetical protein
LRSMATFMFVKMGWVSISTVASTIRLKMLTKTLKSIRTMKRASHYEDNYPNLKDNRVVAKLRAEEEQRPTMYAEVVTNREAVRLLSKQEDEIAALKQDESILRQLKT